MNSVVMSVGGSLIVPDGIDVDFLAGFRKVILDFVQQGSRVAIIAGGGRTCRKYNAAAARFNASAEDKDWFGIDSTKLNARLVWTVLKDVAHPRIIYNPTQKIKAKQPVIVGSGWKPGCSSDLDAVLLAKNLGVRTVVNMTNVAQVYDRDPKKFRDAKPLGRLSWEQMQKIVGTEWTPGMNAPFDPVATGLAAKLGLKVIILGSNLENLRNFLYGKGFRGTVIENGTD